MSEIAGLSLFRFIWTRNNRITSETVAMVILKSVIFYGTRFMFTGLIEAVMPVKAVRRKGNALVLTVDMGNCASQIKIGESIAISGICLTATAVTGTSVSFDAGAETLHRTTLSDITPGSKVNIERAMQPDGRFGGHIVQGHIDGTAKISAIKKQADFALFEFSAEPDLLENIVEKGSVAIDGISLTVASLTDKGFSVAVIPQTLNDTTLGTAKTGDKVNVETDIIIKAVKRQLQQMLSPTPPGRSGTSIGSNQPGKPNNSLGNKQNSQNSGLTLEKLRELGF